MGGAKNQLQVRRGSSRHDDEAGVADELAAQLGTEPAVLVLVFASPRYDSNRLAAQLARVFGAVPVVGCTTAGEIGASGFERDSVVAMSLVCSALRVSVALATELASSALSGGRDATLRALDALGTSPSTARSDRHVVVTMVDGRSGQEELFIAGAAASAPSLGFVGGSASDDLDGPRRARIFFDGKAWSDAGLVVAFDSAVPFSVLSSDHLNARPERLVVTSTDASGRLVHEFNGSPARQYYGTLTGLRDVDITSASFAPLAYYVGGQRYLRSIMAVEGNSLRFACALNTGTVLRLMRAGDMVATTREALRAAERRVGGAVGALVVFNCFGRYLETEATGSTGAVGAVLTEYPVIGFNTFGEQYNALHVNHTMTALVFGDHDDG